MREKIVAIVLAAGEGKRMGSGIPKQYMIIKSRPMVYYSLKTFQDSDVDEIVLVTGADEIEYGKKYIVDKYRFTKVKKIVPGGSERYESVHKGLQAIEDADYVLIHDGARPMINQKIVFDSIKGAMKYGACVIESRQKIRSKSVTTIYMQKRLHPERLCGSYRLLRAFNSSL